MKAVIFDKFNEPLKIAQLADPVPDDDGVVVKVEASGICRSDWHGWLGHDPDITEFPHVPGHELAGTIAEVGKNVTLWKRGDRITVPFVAGCGTCPECESGNHQICDNQFQPGFTNWGSFAEYVALQYADTNLVQLPEEIDFVTAASLGCRFSTSFRAIVVQGGVVAEQWVAVHGCGGVGLSAIMIAHALGAKVIAIDINEKNLNQARLLGACASINAAEVENVVESIFDMTGRGVDVSLDALGSVETCSNSICCLKKGGRHVQIGLMAGEDYLPKLPMHQVIARELQIYGSHGMQAYKYVEMLNMIISGKLDPGKIVEKRVSLEEVPKELEKMNHYNSTGITIIDRF